MKLSIATAIVVMTITGCETLHVRMEDGGDAANVLAATKARLRERFKEQARRPGECSRPCMVVAERCGTQTGTPSP